MNASEFEDLKDKIYYYISKYYGYPKTVFKYKIDEEESEAILEFDANDLDWLCEESEEAEFWNDIRDNARFSRDFHGAYYQLRIQLSFKEEKSEEAESLRLAVEMMDDRVWDEIRSKVFRSGTYTADLFISELKAVLKKHFDADTFWYYHDDDGHRNVAFYYQRHMVILKFFSNSMKHTVMIADTKTRLIVESMEAETL